MVCGMVVNVDRDSFLVYTMKIRRTFKSQNREGLTMQEIIAFFTIAILPILKVLWEVFSIGYRVFKFLKGLAELGRQEVIPIPNDTYLKPEDFIDSRNNPIQNSEYDKEAMKWLEELEKQ